MPVETYFEADPQFPPTEAAPLEALFGLSTQSPEPTPSEMEETRPSRLEQPDGTIATFMYARLHNFAATCQTMAGAELTAFVNDVRRTLSSAILKLGGEIAQRRPDSILCVFSNRPDDRIPDHAKRALHAAILTVHDSVLLAARIAARPQSAGLPPLTMAIGVHLGAGEITPRANNSQGMVHAVGEAVEIARLLEVTASDLHWSIATSAATRQAGGTRVESGKSGSLGLPDDTFLEIVSIAGLVPRMGSTTPPSHYQALRQSLVQNQQYSRTASSVAANATGSHMQTGAAHLLIEGYRLQRKIGEGGIASVFLAQPTEGGAPQVLKILRLDTTDALDGLQRFMQEYALLAQIDHPNVARIFKQDFSVGSAYIAMEYFPLGDLRARMRRPLDPGIALYYVKQIAAGLEAIHQVGIVHRDLKPDNIMVRQDGMVAITDFGVAKQTDMVITDTGAGEIVGTPYYLSPEQALGKPVDARCDIYSLGVLAFELLTGRKPYHASSAQELLHMHVHAPVPMLPPQLAHLQHVMESMMAKDREQRYPSARHLLDDLAQLGV
jgi:serine/threonine-protein kinase PpkA